MIDKTRKELDELRELDKDTKDLQELRGQESTKDAPASDVEAIVSVRTRKMAARLAIYEFILGWLTILEDPEEDMPNEFDMYDKFEYGLTPEEIAEQAKFVNGRIIKQIEHYRAKAH